MYCTDCGNKMRQLAFLMSNPWHCDGCERGGEPRKPTDDLWLGVLLGALRHVEGNVYEGEAVDSELYTHKRREEVPLYGLTLARLLPPHEVVSEEESGLVRVKGNRMVRVEVVE